MGTVRLAVMGAGHRVHDAYGPYVKAHPEQVVFSAVAEPDPVRRAYFQKLYSLEDRRCVSDWAQLLALEDAFDAVMVCMQDHLHFEPARQALSLGYPVMLEKPMALDPSECLELGRLVEETDGLCVVCHVLRYTPFFTRLKDMLGQIGRLIHIDLFENVAYFHQAHSFVRGNWRTTKSAAPMIVAKSCHDMDILSWLVGGRCLSVASVGELTHFKADNAPEGAPERCLDGCPHEKDCLYYAPNFYLAEKPHDLVYAVAPGQDAEARREALKTGPYGRCVYRCDNDVVDHQTVSLSFDNGVTAGFTMCAFTKDCTRVIRILGTTGELHGHMEDNTITWTSFATGKTEKVEIPMTEGAHGGGDYGLMKDFTELVRDRSSRTSRSDVRVAVQSHLMAFAAERSRLTGQTIRLQDFP